jgi:hypothetical protein
MKHNKFIVAVFSFIIILGVVFVSGKTYASGLTSSQIQAILSLLQAFGADTNTVARVQTALNGGTPTPVTPPATSTGPMITSVVPNTVAVGQTFTIYGSNLIGSSSVWFNLGARSYAYGSYPSGTLGYLPVVQGTTGDSITVTLLPELCSFISPCPGPSGVPTNGGFDTPPGLNQVGVTNSNGRSNSLPLTVITTTSAPIITGVSGPQSLTISQQGTWTVNAYSPNGGVLQYSANWGDGPATCPKGAYCVSSISPQQSATFTHTYNTTGTFSPVFTVVDNTGRITSASLSVNVGNATTTTQPTITGVSGMAANPAQIFAGEKFFIQGSNFSPPDTVYVCGTQATVTQDGINGIYAMAPNELKDACYVYVVNGNGTTNQFYVTVGNATTTTQPSIISVSSNYSSYVAGTNNATFSWSRSGNFSAPSTYYFVYLKQTTAQILGGSGPSSYSALYFRVPSLAYPTFAVSLPSDQLQIGGGSITPGTYYLELDYADANGNPIAFATSNAFQITASATSSTSTTKTVTISRPTKDLPFGSYTYPVCAGSSNQYCKDNGYVSGSDGPAYSGGPCAAYVNGSWGLDSNTEVSAICTVESNQQSPTPNLSASLLDVIRAFVPNFGM